MSRSVNGFVVCECLILFSLSQCHVAGVLGGSLLRCDKLDQSEVKNILMCFLHVLKSMSEGTHTQLRLYKPCYIVVVCCLIDAFAAC